MPRASTKRVLRLFASFLILLGLSVSSLLAYGFYLRCVADQLLADVKHLRVGESSYSDAERICRRYRRFQIVGKGSVPADANPANNQFSDACTSDKCLFNFVIVNNPVARFRLIQEAAAHATIAVSGGKVRFVEMGVLGGPHGVNAGIVTAVEDSPQTNRPSYEFPTPIGKPYLHVRITTAASTEIRERAWTLSTRCLMSRTGCNIACDYLPLAWQDWKASLEQKGIDEHDFRISYPEDGRCK
jgi:hypothetical protein